MSTNNFEKRLLRKNSTKLKTNDVSQAQRSANDTNSLTKRKSTSKRKLNRAKTRRQSPSRGLDGNYWNTVPNERHVTKPAFDETYFDLDSKDDDDSPSESNHVIRKKRQNNSKILLYPNQSFITCRSPDDAFYLCQIINDIYNDTKAIPIQWFSPVDETNIDENTHFKPDYKDTLDSDTILFRIKHIITHSDKTYSLSKQDITETNRLLRKSIKGESVSSDESMDTTQPSSMKTKKRRRQIKIDKATTVRKRRRTTDIDDVESKKTKKKSAPLSKARLFKVQSNRFLQENSAITTYTIDPFFEDKIPVPFISSSVQSKLAIRAVLLNDSKLLKSLINDVDRVCSVHIRRDLPKSFSAIHYTIKNNNLTLLEILLEDLNKPKDDRCSFPLVTLERQSTGNASIRMLGFRTAEIMASRGAREGNNALIKDTFEVITRYNAAEILSFALKHNCSREILDLLRKTFSTLDIHNHIIDCIQAGHRELAISLIHDSVNNYGFSKLHQEVLQFDQEDLTVNSACDVIVKTKDNDQITPIHCAAINPNGKYLKQLLAIVPEYKISDKFERKPIHFAAACEGFEPLEYLLSKDVNLNDVDKVGNSPLHIAVTYGRANNAELLLRTAKEKAESDNADDQLTHEKFGLASINQMNKSKYYPLHLAVLNNHLDCIKILLKFGARIDGFTSISAEKLTPLILACQKGYLDIALYLIEQGARVEARDRFKRTPLIHACMYGQTHIVSHLLRMGANANVFDSSMNTALHYSIAYGWYFCVRLLIEAGAEKNCMNCWQTTCLGLSFSKGHYGICDYFLTELQADINFKTDEGVTLVMLTCRLEISSSALQQLEYVVVKHQADCTCVDINGNNALHYLAENNNENEEKIYFQMAQILIDHQCNPLQMNNRARTPFMLAFEWRNFPLIDFFLNQIKLEINSDVNHDGKTFLHYFAMNCDNEKLVQTLLHLPITDELKTMSQMIDTYGQIPFHYCTSKLNELSSSYHFHEHSSYQSAMKMFHYFLDNEMINSTSETCIFHLLRSRSTTEHLVEVFLRKISNVNILHHQTQRTPLLEAIHLNEYQTIEILLKQSTCDVNLATSIVESECQQTPLILACKFRYFQIIRLLLNHSKCDLLAYDDQQNQALHYYLATSTRSDEYMEIFHLFIEKLKTFGPNAFSCPDKFGRTPIHIAVHHNLGTVDFINTVERTLIDHRCDLFLQDNLGNLPLHNVFLTRQIGEDPVELCVLISQGMKYELIDTKNNEGNTPLYFAVIKACTVCVMFLLKHHADLLIENNLSNSIIASCIASNHLNLLITFLYQPIDIDLSKIHTKSNERSVTIEIDGENKRFWKWSLAPRQSKPKMIEQYSLIHLIIQHNWQGALSIILDEPDRFHLSHIQVFEAAIINNALSLVLHLLSNINNSTILNETNSYGQNLFHLIAKSQQYDQEYSRKILNYLYNHHVQWNIPDNYGSYPLHYACVIHNISFIEFLQRKYSNELNWNQTDAFGNTAYGLLFWSSAIDKSVPKDSLRKLITNGRSIDCLCNYDNEIAINPLSFACINSSSSRNMIVPHSSLFGYSKSSSSTNVIIPYPPEKSKYPSTIVRTSPLINAIIHNHFELTQFILELGTDVNFPDEEKRTPLMHAVSQNNIHMVKLLLNKDYKIIDPNQSQPNSSSLFPFGNVIKPKSKGFFLGTMTTLQYDENNQSDEENNSTDDCSSKKTNPLDTFLMTSALDMNASDRFGRTCIHYLIQPFPNASYTDSIELLKLLHQFGSLVTKCDQNGLSPLQYCVMNGYQHLYNTLIDLIDREQMNSSEMIIQCFHVNDPNEDLLNRSVDYYSDAQELINEYIQNHPIESVNHSYPVDPLSNMSQTGEVVINTDKNQPYDVRLTITDVDYGLLGLYNFYRMQIIKHKLKSNFYLLFTRWGRIGDGHGQHQLTPYSSFDECRQEFCKIFRDKTGNSWDLIDQFQKKPKKYTLIQLNQRQIRKYTNVQIDFERLQDEKQYQPSKLKSSIYRNFFRTFLNSETIRTNLRRTQLDVEWMPISQLSPELLQQARDILIQLKQNIQQKEQLKLILQQATFIENNEQTETEEKKTELKRILDLICQLTNEYYSIIPLQGFGDERLPMIDSEQVVKTQEEKLHDIFELELSYKILLATQANLHQISPFDYLYQSINCRFEAMNEHDIDSQFILRYIWASAPHIQVEQIFKIDRSNNAEHPFKPNLDNHYLLWHGTNVCNLISILIRGLLVTPSCATLTGSLFGKGIYTADAFAKSLGYCSGVRDDDGEHYFMFLCEVALGTSQEVNSDYNSLEEQFDVTKYQSRKANGQQMPDPRHTITLNYGVQMPLGQLINCTDSSHAYRRCAYNEFIVFDESQIALRYLVQFRQ